MKKGIEGASKNADLKNTLIILNICRFLLKMIISEKKNTKETQYKVSNRDGFDSEPVFNEKDIKDKIKPYGK